MSVCVLVDPISSAYCVTNWKLVLQGGPSFHGASTACPVVETGGKQPRELCSKVQNTGFGVRHVWVHLSALPLKI